jgi:hypothetical protein
VTDSQNRQTQGPTFLGEIKVFIKKKRPGITYEKLLNYFMFTLMVKMHTKNISNGILHIWVQSEDLIADFHLPSSAQ